MQAYSTCLDFFFKLVLDWIWCPVFLELFCVSETCLCLQFLCFIPYYSDILDMVLVAIFSLDMPLRRSCGQFYPCPAFLSSEEVKCQLFIFLHSGCLWHVMADCNHRQLQQEMKALTIFLLRCPSSVDA